MDFVRLVALALSEDTIAAVIEHILLVFVLLLTDSLKADPCEPPRWDELDKHA